MECFIDVVIARASYYCSKLYMLVQLQCLLKLVGLPLLEIVSCDIEPCYTTSSFSISFWNHKNLIFSRKWPFPLPTFWLLCWLKEISSVFWQLNFYVFICHSVSQCLSPCHTTLHGLPFSSITGSNWQLFHHQLLSDWKVRHNMTTPVRSPVQMGGLFWTHEKHTLETCLLNWSPTATCLIALLVFLLGSWELRILQIHQTSPQEPPVVQVSLVQNFRLGFCWYF